MPTYKIRGIDVDFPYEAYDCQLVYMEKVIQSLQGKCNALLESPTGTGKTLCLLCATLAWRKSLGAFSTGVNAKNAAGSKSDVSLSQSASTNLPTIVYTSRTHSQLRQVIQELKRSNYRPKMVVLGSREQLCIHEKVSLLRGKTQTNACRFVTRKPGKHRCSHFPRAAEYVKINPGLGDEPLDIEDTVNIGKSCGACPYYISRELHKVVDIMFAPYNYLIDPNLRKSLNLQWDSSILIFDEAHNLEGLCAEAASFDLHSGLLTACISEAKSCIDLCVERRENSSDKSRNPENFAILRALLLKFEEQIAEVSIQSKELGFTKPGPYIYEFLAKLNITQETSSKLIEIVEDAAVLLEEDKLQQTKNNGCRLETIGDILKIIFRDGGKAHAKYYQVHVQEVASNTSDTFKGKASRTFSWWCFNPGIAMEEFAKKGVGSIILTSGTLSPMDSFAQELKLEFPIRLENPHVISPNQIWAGVVPAGPSGCSFNSSFRNRDSLEYKQELGNAIVNFARIVPDGLLVFFPSYYLLDQCIGCWKNMSGTKSTESQTIWERICRHKQPVIEPRQSSLFLQSIEDYMAKLKDTSTSGAIFFAVCRGKVSEGLDFADHAGRAVIVTGMPFATRTDPKVRLKREYLDQQSLTRIGECKYITGEEWYNQQASRAVNQAVGRVIRHRHDYGAIIFCDERFAHSNRQSQVSLWIQPHIKCHSKFGDVVFTLTRFFRDGRSRNPTTPKLRTEDRGNIIEMKNIQFLDKSSQEKSESQTLQMGQDFSGKSSSSILESRRGNASSQLGEVLPANRSFLTHYKKDETSLQKCSVDLFRNKKRLLVHGREDMQYQNREIVDLTSDSLSNEKSRDRDLMSRSTKKHKILGLGHDSTPCIRTPNEHPSVSKMPQLDDLPFPFKPVKRERSDIADGRSMQSAGISSASFLEGGGTIQEKDGQRIRQKSKAIRLGPSTSGDDETKGTAFLVQVNEKLNESEYKEFVGVLKVLKSKAVKIQEVLQSIARIFSGQERRPLLVRFKDYIPSSYRSLYEHYFKLNVETKK